MNKNVYFNYYQHSIHGEKMKYTKPNKRALPYIQESNFSK